MYDRIQTLTTEELTKIHDATMDLLKNTGVAFDDPEALTLFKKKGVRVDGKTAFVSEKDVRKAVESAPSHFSVSARNPEKTVSIGGENFALAPGYGAPFIVTPEGLQRKATKADYDNFCKLIQTSTVLNVNGFMMIEPSDLPIETAHLDMLYSNIVLCDKPSLGSPISRTGARDCINMAGLVCGGKQKLKETPVTLSLINPHSPLRYTQEMTGALIELVRHGQAVIIGALVMSGFSGPVSLAGLLVQQNTEILAGLTLAQLVCPEAPVIVGGTSSVMDMRTGSLSLGAPELTKITLATIQIAKFYNLPARAGGALTDAHIPDTQAGFESALGIYSGICSGSNFILHAAGTLGACIAISFEKFILDEELCGLVLELLNPLKVSDETIDLDTIKAVGIGGEYLTHPKTFEQCKTGFYLPNLVNRREYAGWQENGGKRIDEKVTMALKNRLDSYVKPDIDPQLEKELSSYIDKRKKKIISDSDAAAW